MKVPKQLFIEDLSPEQIAVIESRMRPDFLGFYQSLEGIIRADSRLLERYGITHKQIADKLNYLLVEAFKELKKCETLEGEAYFEASSEAFFNLEFNGVLVGYFRVYAIGYGGTKECQFFNETRRDENGDLYLYTCGLGSWDFIITNEIQGTTIHFPELMIHLVRDHHFFEGRTSYRLNPENAIKVLELRPEMK